MRVVVWNMARNSTSRHLAVHERAWHYLAALDPDLALVQEATLPDWATDRWSVHNPSPHWWGSAVVAREGLDLTPSQDGVPHALAAASIRLPNDERLIAISVYAPPVEATEVELAGRDPAAIRMPGATKAWACDAAFAAARDIVRDPFIVAGDWNVSPELWDRLHPRANLGAFFTRASEAGWVDCYRQFHSSEGRTWFRAGTAEYQFDHAFSDPWTAARLRSCDIDPYAAEALGLSDHAPLVIDLDFADESS